MTMRSLLLLNTLVLAPTLTTSALITPRAQCVDGCNAAFDGIHFNGTKEIPYYQLRCTTPLLVQSQFSCIAVYCPPADIPVGLAVLNNSCTANSKYSLPSYAGVMGSTVVDPKSLDDVQRVPQDSTDLYNDTAIPDAAFFANALNSARAFDDNINFSWYFGYACLGYWGLVLLVGMTNRLLIMLKEMARNLKNSADVASRPLLLPRTWSTRIRRHLILPGAFGGRVQYPFGGWCTIPPRLESILLLLFIVMNVVFCFPGYNVFIGNIYWSDTRLQLSRYIADRTGIIAFANFPLIWLFAARNDPFLWLTGWSYASYNRFHRWIARVATAQAIIHSFAYSAYSWIEGDGNYAESWTEQYWYMGGVATITMSLLLGFSMYWLREHYYDFFRAIHIALALVTLIGMWYHIKIFNGDYNGWFWPCVALWSLDWLARLLRLFAINVLPGLTHRKPIKALATYNPSSNMIRIDVTDFFNPDQAVRPGIFYYLYEPNNLRGLESHPFTLCTWSAQNPSTPSSPASSPPTSPVLDQSVKPLEKTLRPLRAPSPTSTTSSPQPLTHSFLIRPYTGWTSRLQRTLSKLPTHSGPISLLLEGPYGTPVHLTNFTDILILCGGSGITAAISHSCELLSRSSSSSYQDPSTREKLTRKTGSALHIVWAVREWALVEEILANELSSILGNENVKIDIYYTPDDREMSERVVRDEKEREGVNVFHTGRPDILGILKEDRRGVQRGGCLAFVCCGPTRMADECRRAVVKVLGEEAEEGEMAGVEFVNDSMVW